MIKHDMEDGFPILTTKKVPFKLVASELEFFIKGLRSKKWLQDRGNHIWDEWCSPTKVPYGNDKEIQRMMREEDDLGPVYGVIWRGKSKNQNIDQLQNIIDTLKSNTDDRRMICMAWSPMDLSEQALPPCHIGFGVNVLEGKLNLWWMQRSVCVGLGLPFNIASYGLLLHLLAKESGLKEGVLTGFLADVHAYENYIPQLKEQLSRKPFDNLPVVTTNKFNSILNWEYQDSILENYSCHPAIKMEIAV